MSRTKHTVGVKEELLLKTNSKCAYCGQEITLDSMVVDHIVPIIRKKNDVDEYSRKQYLQYLERRKELNTIDNLHASCRLCNGCKGALSLEEYRQKIINTPIKGMYRILQQMGHITVNHRDAVFYFEKLETYYNPDIKKPCS